VRKVIACRRAGYAVSMRELDEARKAVMSADLRRRFKQLQQQRKEKRHASTI